jgi:hypothetical protein
MALTFTHRKEFESTLGRLRALVYDITFDASYPTGGEVFTPAAIPGFAIKALAGVIQIGGNVAAGAYLLHYDSVNRKLMIFYPTGGSAAPAALADPVTSVPAGLTAVLSDAVQPNLVETAGRGLELANATDASTLIFRVILLGY